MVEWLVNGEKIDSPEDIAWYKNRNKVLAFCILALFIVMVVWFSCMVHDMILGNARMTLVWYALMLWASSIWLSAGKQWSSNVTKINKFAERERQQ